MKKLAIVLAMLASPALAQQQQADQSDFLNAAGMELQESNLRMVQVKARALFLEKQVAALEKKNAELARQVESLKAAQPGNTIPTPPEATPAPAPEPEKK